MDQQMVSTFMEITSCESQAYAVQHLGSCHWNLDEAIGLYFNAGAGAAAGLSGAPAPISDWVDDDYDGGVVGGYNGDDDVRDPIPARVEALYEEDAYYVNHNSAHDAASMWKAPYPAPAVPVQALSEIEATGWGDAEPGDSGEVGVENVVADDDTEEQEDNRTSSDQDTRNGEDSEQYGDMSYSYSDSEASDDYGLEVDEDDAYYDSSIADGSHGTGGEGAGGEHPRTPALPRQGFKSLDDLYRPPLDLMFNGFFHDAKVRAAREDRFLLVNLQTSDFQSQLHNRDLWSDEAVRDVVKGGFVFLLLLRDSGSYNARPDECAKVSTFYRLEEKQLPAVLVLDPITGQLLDRRSGPMTPDEFMEYTAEYTKMKPSTMSKPKFVRRTSASEGAGVEQEQAAPETSAPVAEAGVQEPENTGNPEPAGACSEEGPVPAQETEPSAETVDDDDEPMEGEKMYKLRIRFPDGTMVDKKFGCKRRVASLFAFCRSASAVRGGGEAEQKAFRITRFAGGGFQAVQEGGGATFEDLGLNFAAVSIVFNT